MCGKPRFVSLCYLFANSVFLFFLLAFVFVCLLIVVCCFWLGGSAGYGWLFSLLVLLFISYFTVCLVALFGSSLCWACSFVCLFGSVVCWLAGLMRLRFC